MTVGLVALVKSVNERPVLTSTSYPSCHTKVAFHARARKGDGDEDGMERTYDLLWHDLIQHREGKGESSTRVPAAKARSIPSSIPTLLVWIDSARIELVRRMERLACRTAVTTRFH